MSYLSLLARRVLSFLTGAQHAAGIVAVSGTRPRDFLFHSGHIMLTYREVAKSLGISLRQVFRLVNDSQIPVVVTTRGRFVRAEDARLLWIQRNQKVTANA